jgi:hypothetical protein
MLISPDLDPLAVYCAAMGVLDDEPAPCGWLCVALLEEGQFPAAVRGVAAAMGRAADFCVVEPGDDPSPVAYWISGDGSVLAEVSG